MGMKLGMGRACEIHGRYSNMQRQCRDKTTTNASSADTWRQTSSILVITNNNNNYILGATSSAFIRCRSGRLPFMLYDIILHYITYNNDADYALNL